MNEKPDEDTFLGQFEKARREVGSWPQWMRDLAYWASATLPVSRNGHPLICASCGAKTDANGSVVCGH